MPDYIKGQKYGALKKDCLKRGELFKDPEFPPNNKSLFYSKQDRDIEWKRPKELCKVPKLVVAGVSCDDLNEGELGNTWFVSACSSLAMEPKMWAKVIPNVKEQEWLDDETKYAGIFHFQFWRYGRWLDVVIDDLLPTKNDKLVFCHSQSRNEFWSALLEKAYAKLYGDYESLSAGFTADALVDFTGGVAEKCVVKSMDLDDEKKYYKFFEDLKVAVENKSLVNVYVDCSKGEVGQVANQGLVKGHGYVITDMKNIKLNKGMQAAVGTDYLYLIRLKNPWNTKEWSGPWSDESQEWQALSQKDKTKIGLTFRNEGEFWMAYKDFLDNFTNVDICHFVNTNIFTLKKSWSESLLHGQWLTGARGTNKDRAGGNSKHPTFLWNPQYTFDVTSELDVVMVSLEQDDVVIGRQSGEGHNVIGFHIMKVESNRKYRVHVPGERVAESEYIQSRNVFLKVELPTSRYVIIPSTDKPNIAGKFLLRVYTTASAHAMPLLKEEPKAGLCSKGPAVVTKVVVQKAQGLEEKTGKEGLVAINPYAIVKCEGETVKGMWAKDTPNPDWDFQTIFYRKHPREKPIIVEIWSRNRIKAADFLGLATIPFIGKGTPEVQECKLYGRGKKEAEIKRPGKLFVEITTDDDLTAL
ncbi:hypothetical protein LSH36_446g02083 [Paralvinella palmiformis]|uniref:Uncharacterized protein n=1 Tax=Paralvinella palmiformis TaxID=53620 RepID=A0AAD9MXL4_9ANNE|nr:hypothetical protein LSH36_446g02083 [Paralvinella palmiformis]